MTLALATRHQDLVGYDVGGTKVQALVRKSNGEIVFRRYNSGDFPSLGRLLVQSLVDLEVSRPTRIVTAIAGPRRSNGDVQMTNQPSWPLFEAANIAQVLAITIETVNDMVAAAAGLATLVIEEQQLLKTGIVDSAGSKLVITVSTGIGGAVLLSDGTPVAGEGGHATWQPMTKLEYEYLQFLRTKYDTDTVTVEVAGSGKQGFNNQFDFLQGKGRKLRNHSNERYQPGRMLKRQVAAYRNNGKDIGELITAGAMAGDAFCQEAMNLLGSILGQHIRNRVVGTVSTGGVFLIGSVVQAPGVASYLANYTPFLKRFVAPGAQHSDMMRATPLYVVTDEWVGAKGALELATR